MVGHRGSVVQILRFRATRGTNDYVISYDVSKKAGLKKPGLFCCVIRNPIGIFFNQDWYKSPSQNCRLSDASAAAAALQRAEAKGLFG